MHEYIIVNYDITLECQLNLVLLVTGNCDADDDAIDDWRPGIPRYWARYYYRLLNTDRYVWWLLLLLLFDQWHYWWYSYYKRIDEYSVNYWCRSIDASDKTVNWWCDEYWAIVIDLDITFVIIDGHLLLIID